MAALLLLVLATAAAAGRATAGQVARLGDLARRDTGDIFTLREGEACHATQCAEHGAKVTTGDYIGACACSCPQRAPLFREDRELCVDDLPECSLATFGTGASTQRIPFVYLPLKGQIIHPSREITFKNVKTPICAVSGAQFLTRKGFLDLRNTLDADVPFNLFRDEGRTFLQWSGEDDVRARMTGRVMVVRLLCRDVAATPTSPLDLRGVFTPCVAFRVQGTPHRSNVTEVQFASNAHTAETTNTSGLTVTEYVAIGISSLLLGLVYVASVLLFLHIRKRRKAASDEGDSLRKLKGLKKKDGSTITERDIVRVNNERLQNLQNSMGQDNGVVKKNPLLSMNRFHDSKNFPSDSGSNLSDSEDFGDSSARSEDNLFHTKTTAALIHQHHNENQINDNTEVSHRDESGIERLPDEHVSIVETTDDREITRPVGTTRRKLYFNPAYFEPHLMADPPPAALEFLVKIREVISIAKHKMESKRFQPVLNEIPEEETYSSNGNSIDVYQGLGSQRSGSAISLKRENSRKKNCLGCPGCKSDNGTDMTHSVKNSVPPCTNCIGPKGDKQHSIRKWLENIPSTKQVYNDFLPNTSQNPLSNSLLSLPITDHRHKIRKQKSFTSSGAMYLSENFTKPKRHSTMSVRSEPARRSHNYNLPLPDFENPNCPTHNYNYYAQTIGEAHDINPIGFNDYRQGSLRNNTVTSRRPKNDLPDMVNEAIALDHCTKSYNQSSSDEERFMNKNLNGIQHPFIRNHSESPVANDYETDSLERSTNKKGIATPTEYLDISSSQASPSLSNALPLEEELTMRNAIYKSSSNSNTPSPHRDISVEQSHYETIGKSIINPRTPSLTSKISANSSNDYSLVSEVYVNNNYNFGSTPTTPSGSECSMGSRKLIVPNNELEEKPGCLTIEVKDSPENYIKIHESDGFEPDTLDRKHPKHKSVIGSVEFGNNLLNFNANSTRSSQRIQLRSSGTFKKPVEGIESSPKFHSLRNEYEQRTAYDRPKLSPGIFSGAKSLDDTNTDDIWEDVEEWESEEGRILTLELRHSKRQRQSTPPTIKQIKSLARPDVLPPLPPSDDEPIYEQPAFPPRRVEAERMSLEMHSKNLNGRSLSPRTFTKKTANEHFVCDSLLVAAESSSSPMRASVQSQSSEYENLEPVPAQRPAGNSFRNFTRKRSDRVSGSGINTNTFVKGVKNESKRFRRKKSIVQDSGYLSSDSTSSRQMPRKLVVAKIVSCSESDDTENEARSESGAESVETHSVYFDNFRKPQIDLESDYSYNNNSKSSRDSGRTLTHSDELL